MTNVGVTLLGLSLVILSFLLLTLDKRGKARSENGDTRMSGSVWLVVLVIGLVTILLGNFPAF